MIAFLLPKTYQISESYLFLDQLWQTILITELALTSSVSRVICPCSKQIFSPSISESFSQLLHVSDIDLWPLVDVIIELAVFKSKSLNKCALCHNFTPNLKIVQS